MTRTEVTPLKKGECRYMGHRSELESGLFAYRPLDGTPPYPLAIDIERAFLDLARYRSAHAALVDALRAVTTDCAVLNDPNCFGDYTISRKSVFMVRAALALAEGK